MTGSIHAIDHMCMRNMYFMCVHMIIFIIRYVMPLAISQVQPPWRRTVTGVLASSPFAIVIVPKAATAEMGAASADKSPKSPFTGSGLSCGPMQSPFMCDGGKPFASEGSPFLAAATGGSSSGSSPASAAVPLTPLTVRVDLAEDIQQMSQFMHVTVMSANTMLSVADKNLDVRQLALPPGGCGHGHCPWVEVAVAGHPLMTDVVNELFMELMAAAKAGIYTFSVCLHDSEGCTESVAAANLLADGFGYIRACASTVVKHVVEGGRGRTCNCNMGDPAALERTKILARMKVRRMVFIMQRGIHRVKPKYISPGLEIVQTFEI